MKRLYIISGVTGALGNALLSRLLQDEDAVVYGISRQARPWSDFVCEQKLPEQSFICSVGNLSANDVEAFIKAIDARAFSSILYVHGLGSFPFEIDRSGKHIVENDADGDGINDLTYNLMYTKFTAFLKPLKNLSVSLPVAAFIFGSLADMHEPAAHRSWWHTMLKVKKYMRSHATKTFGLHVVNISSLLCSHELISRPFVFTATDADPRYWLQPIDLADSLIAQFQSPSLFSGYNERNIYNRKPGFDANYYSDNGDFTLRKTRELFNTKD